MTQYVLVQHGQPKSTEKMQTSFPLSMLGRAQVDAMVDWMAMHWQPNRIWCSPAECAVMTARIVASTFGLSVQIEPDLQAQPSAQEPAGEKGVYQQAARFWQHVQESVLPQDYVLIVTHASVIAALYKVYLGLPAAHAMPAFLTGDTGMHLWEVREGRKTVHFANLTSHLPRELRT